ncbi:hypothetical protein E3T43_07110 [Cryobacterium sp. Hh7]|uniref:hypothetical protein n=1 Tax=Cryobacterium sp. Hh7 TaxID=1259159 RepID=UPI00106C9583|nr:hypothetical protein [Cryobacterium sp. Hh7]TFD58011.1 hypothetical protein E3T43_07110 [Cryobacterium sp. Hh7]
MASMYQAFIELVPDASNLRKTLAKEFDAVGPEAGRNAGKGIHSGILGSIGGLAAPLAAAVAGLGIGKMLADSIGNASDFAEAGTAITAVFGDADQTVQKFAAASAAALGQSTNQTLDAARVFGTFGKAAGLSGEDLAGFSTDFITLSADLASFNNTTPEQAIEALGAGLRGESEPLRQYGVLLDDAALKARATELGIYSGTGALTAQQKVLASQAEIMAQTGLQQGDFAKTSGGLANQQRILSAGLENLSTTFGALLLPVMTTVVGFLNRSVIPALQNVMPAIAGIKSILIDGDFTGAFGRAFDIQEDSKIVDYLFRIREGVLGLKAFILDGDFTGEFRSAFHVEEDSPIVDMLFNIREAFGTIGAAFAPLIPQLLTLWQAFSPLTLILAAIGPQLPGLVNSFVGLAVALAGALGSALADIMPSITALSGALVTILAGVLTNVLPPLMAFAGWLADNVQVVLAFAVAIGAAVLAFQLYTATMAIVRGATVLWAGVQAVLNGVMALNPIGIIVLAIIALVGAIVWVATQTTFFQEAWAVMVDIFMNTMGMFSDFFSNTIGMFVDFFTNTVGMFVDFGAGVVAFISGFWEGMQDTFAAALAFLLDLFFTWHPLGILISHFDQIVAFFSGFFSNTAGMFTDFFTNTIGMFVNFGAGAISLVVDFISRIIGFYVGLAVSIGSTVSGMWSAVTGYFSGFVSGAVSLVSGFASSLVSFFTSMWAGATGAVSSGIATAVGFIAGLPGKALAALGNMGSFLLTAGEDLIQGFIDGIGNMIGNVGDAIGGVMDFVGGFFPHSPAERGPFSGSGWRAVLTAGTAIGDQFGAGLDGALPDVGSMLGSRVDVGSFTPRIDPTAYGSASFAAARSSDRGLTLNYTNNGTPGLSAEEELFKAGRKLKARI